jgi:uncharacterized protein DUF6283
LEIKSMAKKERKIIDERPAGMDHVVTTLEGDDGYRREVCATCPWRLDAVGAFPAEAFLLSARTGCDASGFDLYGEGILSLFACHTSGEAGRAATTCAGYVLRGDRAVGWRIAFAKGKFDPKKVRDGGHQLFESYRAMAMANGVDPNDPRMVGCV